MPELPPHFLPRPEELQRLKDIVLSETNQRVVVTGRMRRFGVQGMGGIGKTVLATALALDDEVRRAFQDGVFWLTFGQTPEIAALQLQLANALSPDRLPPFMNQEDGAACLKKLLEEKTCLLILDDVWLPKHLKAFEALGKNCQMLITTRKNELITAVGGSEHQLKVLNHDQALRLLAEWANQAVETLPSEAHQVARECGNLPLALAMSGAMVRGQPDRWGNVLHKLKSADLEKIRQDFPHYPYPNLLTAIQVSVNDLEPSMQSRYLDFAVFPEDTPIPEAVLQTLWSPLGLDQYDSQDVVDQLVRRSLVRRDHQGHLSLHDLQLDYVGKQFDDLAQLHKQLLEVYRRKTKEGLWHTLPDDGYIHGRLTWHMEEAGWVDEIHKLLREETKESRNGWHEACESLGQTANFVTNVAHAWQLAAKMFEECPSQVIALQCRYALIVATLNSLTANLPHSLLVALLQKHVWAPEQGLAYALQSSNPQTKASLLTKIVDYLPQNFQEEALQKALAAARAIQDEWSRANALSALAVKLPGVLPEALAAAKAIQNKSARANALSALADKLSKMQPDKLFPLWQDTLHSLSLRTRSQLLQDIVALAPVIYALGDRAAVAEVASAIQDVGRWWT